MKDEKRRDEEMKIIESYRMDLKKEEIENIKRENEKEKKKEEGVLERKEVSVIE